MTDTVTNSLLYPGSYDFLVMRNLYVSAAKHISLKVEVLNDDFKVLYARNHIRHIEIRVKSLDSITAKLRKKEFPVSIGSAMKNINDIAGVRVVCNYIDATCNNRTKNIKAQADPHHNCMGKCEFDPFCCGTCGELNPVTRRPSHSKVYNRSKARKRNCNDSSSVL